MTKTTKPAKAIPPVKTSEAPDLETLPPEQTAKPATGWPKAEAKPKRPRGRPSGYTPEIANRILERMAMGESLSAICEANDMPHQSTVFRWISQNEDFKEMYARATSARADGMFERILDVMDKVESGELASDKGRVLIDGLKWTAARMAPQKYSDRVELAGKIGTEDLTPRKAAPEWMGERIDRSPITGAEEEKSAADVPAGVAAGIAAGRPH